MAWNGSDGGVGDSTQRTPSVRDAKNAKAGVGGRRALPLIVAVVCAIAGVVWLFLGGRGSEEETKSDERKPARIREATPVLRKESPTEESAESIPKEKKPAQRKKIPDRVKPDEKGILRWPNGARYVEDYYFHTNAINLYAGQKQLFKAPTDIHISTVVNLEPGQMIIGGYTYDSRFDEQFRKAIKEPVEFCDDDTDEERRKKEAVVEARKVLIEAMERGESPAKVLQEARDELVRLFQYRQNLREMLTTIAHEDGAQEAYDAYQAANKMLRERGLSEFSTRMVERKLEQMKNEEEKWK